MTEGTQAIWQPMESAPNNVVDVLAKYYDAGLDRFLYRRFSDCVTVNGSWFTPLLPNGVSLTEAGYRPSYWMHGPELPSECKTEAAHNAELPAK